MRCQSCRKEGCQPNPRYGVPPVPRSVDCFSRLGAFPQTCMIIAHEIQDYLHRILHRLSPTQNLMQSAESGVLGLGGEKEGGSAGPARAALSGRQGYPATHTRHPPHFDHLPLQTRPHISCCSSRPKTALGAPICPARHWLALVPACRYKTTSPTFFLPRFSFPPTFI
jgi:hypothetical protein